MDRAPRPDGKGFGDALLAGRGAGPFSRDVDVKDASPIRHVSKALPTELLVVGERDFPMLEDDARSFVEKAKAAGETAEWFLAKGRDHMGVGPGAAGGGGSGPGAGVGLFERIIPSRPMDGGLRTRWGPSTAPGSETPVGPNTLAVDWLEMLEKPTLNESPNRICHCGPCQLWQHDQSRFRDERTPVARVHFQILT